MSQLTSSWTEEITLPDEHRIFRASPDCLLTSFPRGLRPSNEFGEWAIADNSGDTPERTEDGILWLDHATRILLGRGYGNTIHLPVMSPDSKRHTVVTDAASLMILSDKFRWTASVDGTLYRTVRW
jgi:hypothetical protein